MLNDLLDQVMRSYAPTSTGTTLQNYIDLKVPMEEGAGADVFMYVNVAATATSGGSATVQFKAVGNLSDPTFASGNITLAISDAIAVASLVAGYQIKIPIKRQDMVSLQSKTTFGRYITIQVIIGTAALTAGTFNGWFSPGPMQDNLSYPAGYAASI